MSSPSRPWKTFLTYPFTWLAAAVMAAATVAFFLLFSPGLLWSIIVIAADALGAALWFVIAFRSKAFRDRLNRRPYENQGREVEAIIRDCPETFRAPALESVRLIRGIHAEFAGKAYAYELDTMLANLRRLAQSQRTLWSRSRRFGDAAQRRRMDGLLAEQAAAVTGALATLRTLSGNLTLLEADAGHTRATADELKDINEGLQEVIKEL